MLQMIENRGGNWWFAMTAMAVGASLAACGTRAGLSTTSQSTVADRAMADATPRSGREPGSSFQLSGTSVDVNAAQYLIGPGDELRVFVWRNPDLSVAVPVRPDGEISVPLVEDVTAAGKTPSGLA